MNGFCVWFTGLSGSGKSTLAKAVGQELSARGLNVQVLDGDEIRTRLTKGLGFSKEDRDENISRISFVARCIVQAGGIAVTSAISPYREARDKARAEIGRFIEVYVATPLQVCMRRDVKGLYKKALAGSIPNFTGVSDPYEPPLNPEVVLDTQATPLPESVSLVLQKLSSLSFLK